MKMKKLYKVPFIAVISVEVFAPLLAGSPTKHTENDIFKKWNQMKRRSRILMKITCQKVITVFGTTATGDKMLAG